MYVSMKFAQDRLWIRPQDPILSIIFWCNLRYILGQVFIKQQEQLQKFVKIQLYIEE